MVLYMSLLRVTDAASSHPAATSTSTISQPGCPSPISLTNGGFESGKIAPWTLLTNSNPTTKQQIVSPGDQSNYALEVNFAAASLTEYSLSQQTTGKECFGYYYNTTYSWNWLNYTGPEGNGPSYCAFSAYTGYCEDNVPQHYATRTPGWHHHSYICRDIYSHCKPAYASFVADVTCVGENNTVLPAFTMLIDAFHIYNAPGSPNPPPTCN